MSNPSIEELQNSEEFELIAELHHSEIKEFVVSRLTGDNFLIKIYMYYQMAMVVFGLFFLTRSIVFMIQKSPESFYFAVGALLFSFTILVPIHELLHGLAIKMTGAPNVNYGAYFRKFIFYAEADRHVLNRKEFAFVALTPLVAIQFLTLIGLLVFWSSSWMYSFAIIMSVHSLFCAGDIGLLSIFYQDNKPDKFTYDVKSEKKSYYYQRRNS